MQAAQPVLKSFLAPLYLYRLSISKTDFIRFLLNKAGGGCSVCGENFAAFFFFSSLVAMFLKIGVLVIPAVILEMHVVVEFFNVILKKVIRMSEYFLRNTNQEH